jgi:hypothetical protein
VIAIYSRPFNTNILYFDINCIYFFLKISEYKGIISLLSFNNFVFLVQKQRAILYSNT